jgi:competence protein ComEA
MKFLITLIVTSMLTLAAWAAEPVNINTASAEQISKNLNGIGLSKAELIVEYRKTHGAFTHVDELVNVKGVGLRTVDKNRGMILLGDSDTQSEN